MNTEGYKAESSEDVVVPQHGRGEEGGASQEGAHDGPDLARVDSVLEGRSEKEQGVILATREGLAELRDEVEQTIQEIPPTLPLEERNRVATQIRTTWKALATASAFGLMSLLNPHAAEGRNRDTEKVVGVLALFALAKHSTKGPEKQLEAQKKNAIESITQQLESELAVLDAEYSRRREEILVGFEYSQTGVQYQQDLRTHKQSHPALTKEELEAFGETWLDNHLTDPEVLKRNKELRLLSNEFNAQSALLEAKYESRIQQVSSAYDIQKMRLSQRYSGRGISHSPIRIRF